MVAQSDIWDPVIADSGFQVRPGMTAEKGSLHFSRDDSRDYKFLFTQYEADEALDFDVFA